MQLYIPGDDCGMDVRDQDYAQLLLLSYQKSFEGLSSHFQLTGEQSGHGDIDRGVDHSANTQLPTYPSHT